MTKSRRAEGRTVLSEAIEAFGLCLSASTYGISHDSDVIIKRGIDPSITLNT
jgi:hypothetical protein